MQRAKREKPEPREQVTVKREWVNDDLIARVPQAYKDEILTRLLKLAK
jgi:hypothetical protein